MRPQAVYKMRMILVSRSDPGSAGFSTKYLDGETGLYYYGLRFYTSGLGRWMSRDPLEEKGGVALYAFCSNTPTEQADPLGQQNGWSWELEPNVQPNPLWVPDDNINYFAAITHTLPTDHPANAQQWWQVVQVATEIVRSDCTVEKKTWYFFDVKNLWVKVDSRTGGYGFRSSVNDYWALTASKDGVCAYLETSLAIEGFDDGVRRFDEGTDVDITAAGATAVMNSMRGPVAGYEGRYMFVDPSQCQACCHDLGWQKYEALNIAGLGPWGGNVPNGNVVIK